MRYPHCNEKINIINIIKSLFKLYCNFECPYCSKKLCVDKAQFTMYLVIISTLNVFLFLDFTSTIVVSIKSIVKIFISTLFMFVALSSTFKIVSFKSKQNFNSTITIKTKDAL